MPNFDFLDKGFYDNFALLSCKEPMIGRVDLSGNSHDRKSSDDSSQFLYKFRAYGIKHYLLDHQDIHASNVNPGSGSSHVASSTPDCRQNLPEVSSKDRSMTDLNFTSRVAYPRGAFALEDKPNPIQGGKPTDLNPTSARNFRSNKARMLFVVQSRLQKPPIGYMSTPEGQ